MFVTQNDISKAIIRSQHCQRNWDLSKEIPAEDMELFETAVSQCPSKQNIAHYRVHMITNREIIESIHQNTDGFTYNYYPKQSTTNSQVLANLLIAFEAIPLVDKLRDYKRNDQVLDLAKQNEVNENLKLMDRDANMAVGIAAGYVNVIASILGYSTGCCACFDGNVISKIIGGTEPVILLMGVGFKNPEVNRRVHHMNPEFMFPALKKQPILVNRIK